MWSKWARTGSVLASALAISRVTAGTDESVFPGGETQLLLPEVGSKLNFDATMDFAPDNDTRAETELRNTRFWGRLYVHGWPQPIQYFLAHFSAPPGLGDKPLMLAEPEMACEPLKNADAIREGHALVLAKRGNCTFGSKAHMAHAVGASGIIFVNDRPGVLHAPGPDAHDIEIAAVMISQQEGELLWSSVQAADGPRVPAGRLIPMHCAASNTAFQSSSLCEPTTRHERDFVHTEVVAGGLMHVADRADRFEYLMAHFGTWMPQQEDLLLAAAEPVDACSPLTQRLDGRAAVVERGSCSYLDKALNVQAAGGRALLVYNTDPTLVRAGVEPRAAGLNVTIPVASVSKDAGVRLKGLLEAGLPVVVRMEPRKDVAAHMWEELVALQSRKAWPRHPRRAKEMFRDMSKRLQGWPERLEALMEGYVQVNPRGREEPEL